MEVLHGEQTGDDLVRTSSNKLRSGESMFVLSHVARIDTIRTPVLGRKQQQLNSMH